MKKIAVLFSILTLVFFFSACASSNTTRDRDRTGDTQANSPDDTGTMTGGRDNTTGNMGSLSAESMDFLQEAASAGMMEVELGNLASQKGSSQEVKDFGEKMVQDHTRSNAELMSIASQKNVDLPKSMMDEHQSMVDMLSNLSGEEFDKAYINHMAEDHEEDIEKFEEAANDVQDSDLKAFAQKTLPILQQHLQTVKQIQQNLENGGE